MAIERDRYAKEGWSFDPVAWLGDRLTATTFTDFGQDGEPRLDISLVWDSISYRHIKSEKYKETVASTVLTGTALRRKNIAELTPKSVMLIDAMAEAAGIPHQRGQRRFDLLPTPGRRQEFRTWYPVIAQEMGI